MELTWRGYGMRLGALGNKAEGTQGRRVKLSVLRPPSREQRHEVERQHIVASGGRYVSPIW